MELRARICSQGACSWPLCSGEGCEKGVCRGFCPWGNRVWWWEGEGGKLGHEEKRDAGAARRCLEKTI